MTRPSALGFAPSGGFGRGGAQPNPPFQNHGLGHGRGFGGLDASMGFAYGGGFSKDGVGRREPDWNLVGGLGRAKTPEMMSGNSGAERGGLGGGGGGSGGGQRGYDQGGYDQGGYDQGGYQPAQTFGGHESNRPGRQEARFGDSSSQRDNWQPPMYSPGGLRNPGAFDGVGGRRATSDGRFNQGGRFGGGLGNPASQSQHGGRYEEGSGRQPERRPFRRLGEKKPRGPSPRELHLAQQAELERQRARFQRWKQ